MTRYKGQKRYSCPVPPVCIHCGRRHHEMIPCPEYKAWQKKKRDEENSRSA